MLSKLSEKLKAALFLVVGLACFFLAGGLVYLFPKDAIVQPAKSQPATTKEAVGELYENLLPQTAPTTITEVQSHAPNNWVLYITGSVNKPGVYRLQEEARVYQLVEAAGGLTSVADEVAVNMAAILADGGHLHVPQKGERRNDSANVVGGANVHVVTGAGTGAGTGKPRLIDLNSATESELQSLPGIGATFARRIVEYRQKNGRFKQVADLIDVPGIGGKRLEAISPLLTAK